MRIAWWKFLVLGVLVGSVAVTGCKKKPKAGGAFGDDNIGGVMGTDIYGDPLDLRPGEGARYEEGQFSPVYFEYDSSQVSPSERGKLDSVASELRSRSNVGLVVEGHCDERGSREYNLALGERRALAVRAYLIGLGVEGSLIQTKSYGEEQPADMGHDEGAWSANRRAEFVLFY